MAQMVRKLSLSSDGVLCGLPDLEQVRRTGEIEPLEIDREYEPYTKMSVIGKFFRPSRGVIEKESQEILERLLDFFRETAESDTQFRLEKAKLSEQWPNFVETKLSKYKGLRQFMKDYGVYSRGFFTFLQDVPTAMAMLPAYGLMRDLWGNIVPIPEDDGLFRFAAYDRVFTSVRFRCQQAQTLLTQAKEPLFLGAGLLPELWMNERQVCQDQQNVTAYDVNPHLVPYLRQLFGRSITIVDGNKTSIGEGGRLTYNIASMNAAFSNPNEMNKHDFVFVMGVGSYYRNDLPRLLNGVWDLLTDDGFALIDFQTLVPELLFDEFVLGWESKTPLKPFMNYDAAESAVRKMAETNGFSVVQSDTDDHEKSAGVVFLLAKAKRKITP